MQKIILLMVVLSTSVALSQNGNTINNAIPIDGENISLIPSDIDNATASGLLPACSTTADLFYSHTVSLGDNNVTIGMFTVDLLSSVHIFYQILLAPAGNLNNLQELACDSYQTTFLIGGGFEEEYTDNLNVGDVYYLRVYKGGGVDDGGFGIPLLPSSEITLHSTFDSRLSNNEVNKKYMKVITKSNQLTLLNNYEYSAYNIYSLDGKNVSKGHSNTEIETINISGLNQGIYIVNLTGNDKAKSFKFIKN